MDEFEEESEPRKKFPPAPAKMSKVPSWISVGFVLGALFVMALPKPETKTPPPPAPRVAPPPRAPAPVNLTTIEAVFDVWGKYVVWDGDTTEIASWNPGTEDFTDFYEVKRIDGELYFRTIPKLTRRIVRHGRELPPECPLQFTETEAQYRDWREQRVERPAPPPREPPNVPAPLPTKTP
jgi:hypothetical protein